MVGWTNATGDMLSFDSIVMTYTVGSSVYTLRGGKVYLNGSVVASNLPFSIVTGGTNKRLWEIHFLKSGTARFQVFPNAKVDVFCVGGGGGAAPRAGGGGGYTKTTKNISVSLNTNYSIVIGAGGAAGSSVSGNGYQAGNGGTSSGFGVSAGGGKGGRMTSNPIWWFGGNGGSGGGVNNSGGTNGGDGSTSSGYGETAGTGQHTTTRAFGASSGTAYAGGGAGNSSSTPTANTGHGGNANTETEKAGATGRVIIRNKR